MNNRLTYMKDLKINYRELLDNILEGAYMTDALMYKSKEKGRNNITL